MNKRFYFAAKYHSVYLVIYDPNDKNIIMYIATSERTANVKKAEISRKLGLKHMEKCIIKVVKIQVNMMLYDPECLPMPDKQAKDLMILRGLYDEKSICKQVINLSKK